jgi:hypothetical protein
MKKYPKMQHQLFYDQLYPYSLMAIHETKKQGYSTQTPFCLHQSFTLQEACRFNPTSGIASAIYMGSTMD